MNSITDYYRQFGMIETPSQARQYDGYHELANAIVLQAIEDYRNAVCDDYILDRQYERGEIPDDDYLDKSKIVKSNIRSLSRFFRGAWCEYLTELDCLNLPKKLKTESIEFVRLAEKAISDPRTEGIDRAVWEQMTDLEKSNFKNVFRCPTCGGAVSMEFGVIGWEGNKQDRVYQYGWRVKCQSCEFKYSGKVRTTFKERSMKK